MKNIGMIGAGNMAEAMLTAWLRQGLVDPAHLRLADIRPERLAELSAAHGVGSMSDNATLAAWAEVLVLGVKPQQLDAVLDGIRSHLRPETLVISIAAGKRLDWLESRLPSIRVVRVMPNIACRVADAMSAFSPGQQVTAEDRKTVAALLEAFGRVMELPDQAMDGVTAISGSGPAFFARMAKAMAAEGAAQASLTESQALCLAAQTMLGTAKLMLDGGMSPDQLIAAVSSARGTTVAGLEVMDRDHFDELITETIKAASRRSRELAGADANPA